MRDQLAALSDSACYAPSLVKRVDETIEVFCDGVRLPLAFAYCVKLGYADCFVEDPATGGLQRDGLVGELRVKRVEGKIETRTNDEGYESPARIRYGRRVGPGGHARADRDASRNHLRGGLQCDR
jgi:hypothetical protein